MLEVQSFKLIFYRFKNPDSMSRKEQRALERAAREPSPVLDEGSDEEEEIVDTVASRRTSGDVSAGKLFILEIKLLGR